MSRTVIFVLGLVFLAWGAAASAQGISWIQIEARPTEAQATERARDYAGRLPDVNGFSLPSGWYAIALGPYDTARAEAELRRLRALGSIPRDSFISDGRGFGRSIFGGGLGQLPAPTETAAPPPVLVPAEESLADSRAAERLLTREERAEIQEALQWEGFYASTIDASFGPGTRRAMGDWQAANGYEPTGVLSTVQRRELVDGYREVLTSLGMRVVRDSAAGIEIALPMAMVEFDRNDPPFAHYTARDGGEISVLLISQTGDEATLFGLYDIMQTLEIVPLSGPRDRSARSFTLTGANDRIVSTTYAELTGGTVKGFTLIWPAGDEKRRTRVLQEMRASFTPIDGVLPDTPVGGASEEQRLDLLSGLQIRQPERTRSGFFVDARGRVLTGAEAVQSCARITLGEDVEATVTATDAVLGVALLEPGERLAPIGYARFQAGVPRLQSEVAVAGYPYGGVLTAPTLSFGTLSDLRGLSGEENLTRLALAHEAGESGGPVFDATGSVIGLLLPRGPEAGRELPPDVSFAADAAAIATFLSANGVTPSASDAAGSMAPEDLTALAADMTVLVSCWN